MLTRSLLISPYSFSRLRLSANLCLEGGFPLFARVVAIVLVVAGFLSSSSLWMVCRRRLSVGVA